MTDKPIQLVRGKGSPTEGACWASALALWTGEKTWTDRPSCVSPVIVVLCQRLNDMLGDRERWPFIAPHFEVPLSTNTGLADDVKRAQLCAQYAQTRAAAAAAHAAAYADAAAKSKIKAELLQLILDCCAIGERKEPPLAMPRKELLRRLAEMGAR